MNNSFYKSVFNNIYLSTKIFNIVHRLQLDKNSFKYEDIVDIGWMIKYDHLGLLREKINNKSNNRQQHLFIEKKDIFLLSNTDTELFIKVFQENKDYVLMYFDSLKASQGFAEIKNVNVVRFLFENGCITQKDMEIIIKNLLNVDIKVLEFLLENGMKCDPMLLLDNIKTRWLNLRVAREVIHVQDIKNKVQLLVKYMQSPISINNTQRLVQYILDQKILFVLESLSTLFDSPAVQELEFKGSLKNITMEDVVFLINEMEGCAVKKQDKIIVGRYPNVDLKLDIWYSCTSVPELIDLLDQMSSKIRVTTNTMYFNPTGNISPQTNSYELSRACTGDNILDLAKHIIPLASKMENGIDLLHHITSKGFTIQSISTPACLVDICRPIVNSTKPINDKDLYLILKMMFGQSILLSFLGDGKDMLDDNFNFIFSKFRKEVSESSFNRYIPLFFKSALLNRNYRAFRLLQSLGYQFSNWAGHFTEYIQEYSFKNKYLLDDIDRLVYNQSSLDLDEKYQKCKALLCIAIKHNDYYGVKYVFNKFKFQIDFSTDNQYIYELLAASPNLAIIDYISKNRSICFQGGDESDYEQFLLQIFKLY
ncbi:hypothetical protein CYY_008202 [Polysphondylium violaceum]|uniref:Ankyrin repeat protein n=1 Tax=Polysphondylium violaceum TaxID=133409 RepID=A0A8J4PNY7_9MYCE|nr:hypothetical protein CYY_008202 [Polysphondylium violaceum]